MNHPFEVGKEYRNRNGRYEVLAIAEPKMRIRYENGREQVVDIAIQTRIGESMQHEASQPKAAAVPQKGYTKTGTIKSRKNAPKTSVTDEREKLIAEILEDDAAIFEILTRLVIPPGQINIFRFLLRNPDDYFSQQQIADVIRNSDRNSLGSVYRAFGNRIANSPDPRVRSLKPYNTLFFQHKKAGGKTLYRIRQRVADIFGSYQEFYDFLMNDNRAWLPEEFGSPDWTNNRAVHHAQLHYFGFWDRYQDGHKR